MAFDQTAAVGGAGVKGGKAARERRRLAGASLAAVLIHLGFALLAVWSFNSSSFSGGAGAKGGDGGAVMVSLVGPIGAIERPSQAVNAQAAAQEAELDALMHKIRAVTPDGIQAAEARPKGDVGKLFDEIAKAHSQAAAGGDAGASTQSQAAKGAPVQGRGIEGAADQRGDQGHASGDVFGQLQTCWRPDAVVPVTLEVVIDSGGRLVRPPKILRPDNAPLDERRLIAEARAVTAVASCAPFRGGPLFGTKTYRFAFAPRP